jgi:hypothetical protein
MLKDSPTSNQKTGLNLLINWVRTFRKKIVMNQVMILLRALQKTIYTLLDAQGESKFKPKNRI